MQETKAPRDPKKSLWASYLIIFLLVIGFNALFMRCWPAPGFGRWTTAPFCRCWRTAS